MVGMGNERDVDVPFVGESRIDDAVIVQIDSGDRTKRLRVMLNEAVLFDGDPEDRTTLDRLRIYRGLEKFEAAAHQLSLDIAYLRGGLAAQIEASPGVKL